MHSIDPSASPTDRRSPEIDSAAIAATTTIVATTIRLLMIDPGGRRGAIAPSYHEDPASLTACACPP